MLFLLKEYITSCTRTHYIIRQYMFGSIPSPTFQPSHSDNDAIAELIKYTYNCLWCFKRNASILNESTPPNVFIRKYFKFAQKSKILIKTSFLEKCLKQFLR